MVADMERYSRRSSPLQREAQAEFVRAMDIAAAAAGLRSDDWRRQASGDGELVILPAEIPEAAVLSRFLRHLDGHLRRLNAKLQPVAKIRVRIALHQGPVYLDGANGYPGHAVNTTARLVEADELKAALRAFPEAAVACIVSDGIYRDVVTERYDDLRPERFLAVRVNLPDKAFSAPAWIQVVDEDVTTAQPKILDQQGEQDDPSRQSTAPAGPGPSDSGVQIGSLRTKKSPTAIGDNAIAVGSIGKGRIER
jgi:hypothetical protein